MAAQTKQQSVPLRKTKGYLLRKNIMRHWQLYFVIALPLVYLVMFKYMPLLGSQIAFRKYSFNGGIWGSPWVGMDNFKRFFSSPDFTKLLWNTIALSLYNIVVTAIPPIVMAVALNYARWNWFGKTVQMVTYMPYFISTVLIVGILQQMLSLTGPLNNFIASVGGAKIHFMGEPGLFRTLYVFSGVWQSTGYSAVIYLAALAAVDQELHEAAVMDGASIWRRIWHIDLPSIIPTAIIQLIMACGRILTMGYEKTLLMQNDMNLSTSDIISTYVYRVGLNGMQYSYSTAIGLFQSVVSLLMLMLVNWIASRVGETSLF
ncbi:MAG: sugar ABC transporter permease [Oscillospiraceae bacterium]|jgi:ABC-type polysaccharide transport system permease subunit|nr:sugar ABC transporter permease [Oscillospiraceae bacterium]